MGLFVRLAEPTAPMKKEAASAGVLDTPFGKFARLQILTIEGLFAGKKPAMPPEDPAAFRRACKSDEKNSQLQEDRLILMARPLGQIIVQIDHPHAIEDVTGWLENFRNLWRDPKIEERWKRKPHMASFIRKGSAA